MKHLQTYRIFESSKSLTKSQREFLDKYTKGTWSLNPSTGEVDIEGSFDCSTSRIQSFKGIKFGRVSGSFKCTRNLISSLEGCPHTVGKDFDCSVNKITSLEGGPKFVGGFFSCQNTDSLVSLAGAPEFVGTSFSCVLNSVKSLEGLPENMSVGSDFSVAYNNITSLVGAPKSIKGSFSCYTNKLEDLEGSPESVGGQFDCSSNDLKSLEGAPEKIGGGFRWRNGSDELVLSQWSTQSLLEVYKTGTRKQKQLVSTLIGPEVLQQEIDKGPEKMLVKLKGLLKDPHFQGLKWPKNLEREKELLSDLSDIGL